ncbi:hypothetical protein GSI_02517 [Ganoderma sinense ZZ0214-1]|uniref:FAD-binding PCMH-type domain-containing protein n=1 Tax=Ganoderma sinense ZZ0214-1 TaxID=1077348 RepID=A0A2G8SPT5_9APHY|nr:hypothetical protein GSI_02517 [Ganoderma sinense ZZ0214-1]
MHADGRIEGCYMETSLSLSCEQGNVPVVDVAAWTVSDIQHAVKFAGKHNLRVVVKNTGHDFLGRSNGRGSFMIWTHYMKSRSIHDTWSPNGAPPDEVYGHVLIVEAGVQWQEAYMTANNAGRMIVGGISPGGSVGAAGGWILGGGHSALSPTYGLGVDNVLEISLVTAHGEHITANAYQHTDLFWALRGGGGGTFGVVTSVTYRTYPIVPTTIALLVALVNTPEPNLAMKAAFTELVRISTNLTDQGWGGYAQFTPSANATIFSLGLLVPNVSLDTANRTIRPYFNFVRSLTIQDNANNTLDAKLFIEVLGIKRYPSFWDLYQSLLTGSSSGHVGYNLELGSWLMPRIALEKNYAQIADILITNPGLSYELVAGGAVSKVDQSSTGLNPAWRKAGAHVVSGITWADGLASSAHIEGLRGELDKRLKTVRALAPDSGAYFNEASMFEPDPQITFFGDHYAKLRSIKQVYDPHDLFIVIEGVGAEGWDKELKSIQGWFDGNWRANHSGAMQNINYEAYIFPNGTIDACYLNTTLGAPCRQGSVSVIGVDARTVEDIQAAVMFAAKHEGLRLVVKNTGHDYLGRSDGRGSFLVWTHNLKNISVRTTFRPTGAPPDTTYEYAITLGSGVQWHEAYAAASAANRTLVGGASLGGSVGAAAGWLLGAGHSALSPSYGLGVDIVLEFSLVTSAGTYLTANAYQYPDLFWALRGGGGGTFGVVTSVTYQTRPSTPVVTRVAELVRITPALETAGWGGYSAVIPNSNNGRLLFAALCIVPNVSFAQGNATVLPFLDYVRSVAANSSASGNPQDVLELEVALTTQSGSFYEWYNTTFNTNGSEVGSNVQLGSWLLPTDAIEEKHEDIAQTLLGIEGGFNYYLVAGGAVSKVPASDKGLNPAWRRAAAHIVLVTNWPSGATADEINQARAGLKANTATLRAIAPESGAYFNEASPYEPDPEQAFFALPAAARDQGLVRPLEPVCGRGGCWLSGVGRGADLPRLTLEARRMA